MKRVLIATPCLTGRAHAWYINSLCDSIPLAIQHDIGLKPVFLVDESILPMARNELVTIARNTDVDAMVFIDDDQRWQAQDLIDLIENPRPVLALPVVNKGFAPREYNVYVKDAWLRIDAEDHCCRVTKVGTGFLKLDREVIRDLCDSSMQIKFRGRLLYQVFEYGQMGDDFVGEDINLCHKLDELGHEIWINPYRTVDHVGQRLYRGDFAKDHGLTTDV